MTVSGRLVIVSGQVGWNPERGEFASDDIATQTGQALRNIVAVLASGGAEPRHLVRLTWYVVDRQEYVAARAAIGTAYRKVIGSHFPAMSLVIVAGLLEERARVEIEATAVVPR
ncbi:MAG: RidA family protein [Gemmatimonadales bacterium]|nr:RidA family protein [Gemmatimonadales bacterium]